MWRIASLWRGLDRVLAEVAKLIISRDEPELVLRHAANINQECKRMVSIVEQMYKEREVKL